MKWFRRSESNESPKSFNPLSLFGGGKEPAAPQGSGEESGPNPAAGGEPSPQPTEEKASSPAPASKQPSETPPESAQNQDETRKPEGAAAGAEPAPPQQKELTPEQKKLQESVTEVLKTVYDPEIPVNIHDLGLIYGIDVDENNHVHIRMTLTAPNCPAAQTLPSEVQFKAEQVDGVKSAEVDITFDPPWSPEKMSDSAKLALNIM